MNNKNKFTVWATKILLGALVVSFAFFFGISDLFQKSNPLDTIATVGNLPLKITDFQKGMAQDFQRLETTLKKKVTFEEVVRMGLPHQHLMQMINASLLQQEVERLGLTVTDTQVMRFVQAHPIFRDAQGVFDPKRLTSFLKERALPEKRFLAQVRTLLKQQQLLSAIKANCRLHEEEKTLLLQGQKQKRQVVWSMHSIEAQKIRDPQNIRVLENFFNKNKELFRIPQLRSFTFLQKTPQNLDIQSQNQLRHDSEKIDDALAEGVNLEEIASLYRWRLQKIQAVDPTCRQADGQINPQCASLNKDLLKQAFVASAQQDNQLIAAPGGGYFIVRVDHVQETKIPTFSEAKKAVLDQWRTQQKKKSALEAATRQLQQIRKKKKVAGLKKLPPFSLETLHAQTTLPQPVKEMIFRLERNQAEIVETSTAVYLVHLLHLENPPPSSSPVDPVWVEGLQEDWINAYLQSLKVRYPVTLNEAAITLGIKNLARQ